MTDLQKIVNICQTLFAAKGEAWGIEHEIRTASERGQRLGILDKPPRELAVFPIKQADNESENKPDNEPIRIDINELPAGATGFESISQRLTRESEQRHQSIGRWGAMLAELATLARRHLPESLFSCKVISDPPKPMSESTNWTGFYLDLQRLRAAAMAIVENGQAEEKQIPQTQFGDVKTAILEVLGSAEKLLKREEIAARTGETSVLKNKHGVELSVKTIGTHLLELESMGYVDRPEGKRKGWRKL